MRVLPLSGITSLSNGLLLPAPVSYVLPLSGITSLSNICAVDNLPAVVLPLADRPFGVCPILYRDAFCPVFLEAS